MNAPIVKADMLIRKPVGEVFNAFVDPIVADKAPDHNIKGWDQ
ncbi:MAG: hypothetical protein ACK4X1_07575 [Terricaulis sp.]